MHMVEQHKVGLGHRAYIAWALKALDAHANEA